MKNILLMKLQLLTAALLFLLAACSAPQPLFESGDALQNDPAVLNRYFAPHDPVLRPGDKITITVWGNEDLSIGSVNSNFNSNEETGKWLQLDNAGEVTLPRVGRIKLSGYNAREANYLIEQKLTGILNSPQVNVRVLNHYVTVLGEVKGPGKYELQNERTNLLQMLGEASGLTDYANAGRVKLIREINGKPIELLINLESLNDFDAFNIVLQPNDVLYVEAGKSKTSEQNLRKATPIASIVTALGVIAALFIK